MPADGVAAGVLPERGELDRGHRQAEQEGVGTAPQPGPVQDEAGHQGHDGRQGQQEPPLQVPADGRQDQRLDAGRRQDDRRRGDRQRDAVAPEPHDDGGADDQRRQDLPGRGQDRGQAHVPGAEGADEL